MEHIYGKPSHVRRHDPGIPGRLSDHLQCIPDFRRVGYPVLRKAENSGHGDPADQKADLRAEQPPIPAGHPGGPDPWLHSGYFADPGFDRRSERPAGTVRKSGHFHRLCAVCMDHGHDLLHAARKAGRKGVSHRSAALHGYGHGSQAPDKKIQNRRLPLQNGLVKSWPQPEADLAGHQLPDSRTGADELLLCEKRQL